MHKQARALYNASFSEERFQKMLHSIDAEFPGKLDFRIAETPVFLSGDLYKELVKASESIIDVIRKDDFQFRTERALPPQLHTPNENAHSSFLAIDFAICKDQHGNLTPQLIELQGFPSLFGYQGYLGDQYRTHFNIPPSFSPFPHHDTINDYNQNLKEILLEDNAPEEVILLEIYPDQQKTRIDFAITEQLTGIKTVCITQIIKRGTRLYYSNNGKEIRIKRIYNRLINDELQQYPGLKTQFSFTDDVEVTWVGHPNWFFRISKYIMPFLNNPYVPPTSFVSDYNGIFPDDLHNYVLKPLFSFAGTGVELHVTPNKLRSLIDPENYILQRKVSYEPVIQSPDGGVKAEIRMLYVWADHAASPVLFNALSRLSRGEMIGVRYNKDFKWVGSSACFFEK